MLIIPNIWESYIGQIVNIQQTLRNEKNKDNDEKHTERGKLYQYGHIILENELIHNTC